MENSKLKHEHIKVVSPTQVTSLQDITNSLVNRDLSGELRRCSRTLGYFTPVHERGTKWDNIEEHIPTISRQAPLIGFMNLAQLKAA
jgi:hypothetical protein